MKVIQGWISFTREQRKVLKRRLPLLLPKITAYLNRLKEEENLVALNNPKKIDLDEILEQEKELEPIVFKASNIIIRCPECIKLPASEICPYLKKTGMHRYSPRNVDLSFLDQLDDK